MYKKKLCTTLEIIRPRKREITYLENRDFDCAFNHIVKKYTASGYDKNMVIKFIVSLRWVYLPTKKLVQTFLFKKIPNGKSESEDTKGIIRIYKIYT